MDANEIQRILGTIYAQVQKYRGKGAAADYIPALANADTSRFGIAVQCLDGSSAAIGDSQLRFSVQSISKVFTFAMVSRHLGDALWASVGREPSGTAFNSLVQLEYEKGIPRNPFINAGALVVTDKLISLYPRPKDALLRFVRDLTGNDDIYYDRTVARSERETAHRNLAVAHFMKSFGNIDNDVEQIIDVYCHQCALSMSCADLARAFTFLAAAGTNPLDGSRILSASQAKRLGAVMLTCGCYDESGDFAFRVGLPGKSGVGGGIAAYLPGRLAIAVYAPELNRFGNSVMGIEALERFTTLAGNSIF